MKLIVGSRSEVTRTTTKKRGKIRSFNIRGEIGKGERLNGFNPQINICWDYIDEIRDRDIFLEWRTTGFFHFVIFYLEPEY